MKGSEPVMSEIAKRTECLQHIVNAHKHLSVSESTQIFRKLMIIIDERHNANDFNLWLTPENIQLTNIGAQYLLTADIQNQYARFQKEASALREDSVGFRAPEVALKDYTRIGKQSDYYAATAIFYYCLTGRKLSRLQMFHPGNQAFSEITTLVNVDPGSMKALQKILKKGLSPELRFRYQSAAEIQYDITELEKCIKHPTQNNIDNSNKIF